MRRRDGKGCAVDGERTACDPCEESRTLDIVMVQVRILGIDIKSLDPPIPARNRHLSK